MEARSYYISSFRAEYIDDRKRVKGLLRLRNDGYTLLGRETIRRHYDPMTVKASSTFVPVQGLFGVREKPVLLITDSGNTAGVFLMNERDISMAVREINAAASREIGIAQRQEQQKKWRKYESRIQTQPIAVQVTDMTIPEYRSFDSERARYDGDGSYFTMLDGQLYYQRYPKTDRLLAKDDTQRTVDTNEIHEVIQYHYEVCIQNAFYPCYIPRCSENGTAFAQLRFSPDIPTWAPGVCDHSNPKDSWLMGYTVPVNGIIRVTAKHYRLTPPSQE